LEKRIVGLACRIDLKLRSSLLRVYNLIAGFISKIKIFKLRIQNVSLGQIIYSFFIRVLYFGLPDPIEVRGTLMYHRTLDGRGCFGWLYAFDYEPQTQQIFTQIIKPGMSVVDVGAHIGYYALLAAELVGDKGKVYAFEPDPSYYALLEKNIAANKINAIVESHRLAVSNQEGKFPLFLGKSTGTSLFKVPDSTERTVTIDVITLDKFFKARNWPPLHFIKIDVEGADKDVLEGMRDLITRNPDLKLIIEFNSSYLELAGVSPGDLLIRLGELSFNKIKVLAGEVKSYKIPQDIQSLLKLGLELKCVNLFCTR
jgi:FkbM family methyltransferase